MAIEGFALGALTDPNGDLLSDTSLIRQLIDGSQDAVERLYDRHGQAVFAAAFRVSRDREIAAEVVQDTFLTLWNRAELFDPSRGALSSWLMSVARNRAIDRLRAAGRHDRAATFSSFAGAETDGHSTAEWLTSTGDLVGAAGPEPGPEVALADKETRELIQDAVASLSPLERRVIELAYGTGLSQSEIAAQLGWPIGTVKTRTRRALGHIRERLERSHTDAGMQGRIPVAGRREPHAWHSAVNALSSARTTTPCISPC